MKNVTSAARALLVLLPALPGCLLVAGAAVGAGGYAFVTGEATKVYEDDIVDCRKAAEKACDTLGFLNVHGSNDELRGMVEAEQTDGTDIKIKLERVAEDSTKIGVRVGVFGDEATSKKIHQEIQSSFGLF